MDCNLKPDHKIIKTFYQEVTDFLAKGYINEGQTAPFFANILRHCTKSLTNRDFVEQYTLKLANKKSLRLDGALVDAQTQVLIYGIWEAKDLKDDLIKEIDKKFKHGYPQENILFQTPNRLILFQNGELCFDKDISCSPKQLIDGLELFFSYIPPAYVEWEIAADRFKDKVADLGQSLVKLIEASLKNNAVFIESFNQFKAICQQSINPNLSNAVMIEMIAQHLLTERLFRNVFNNSDFINKNIIAHEIEKVITALTSKHFSREHFLQGLDRFYIAIESAARTIQDFSTKQTFLNTIYEKFFQGFAIKVADTHGIVYTPQPIVDFMINSVEQLLATEFQLSLSSENVHVLDPFVGTGNFIVHILQKLDHLTLKHKYQQEIHCNELLLLPYYVASMNIEHAYFERTQQYLPFEGICLVDTFETLKAQQKDFFNSENAARVKKQQKTPLFVIIGNPPYNAWQQNENDNNKNKVHQYIDDLIKENYVRPSKATNKNALFDPYVKAFTWATERLKNQENGIVAFVSNNGFIDNLAFDGMRKSLNEQFSSLYILDLGGNVRKNVGVKNVFGIKVGVSINLLIKKPNAQHKIFYAHIGDNLSQQAKLEALVIKENVTRIDWQEIVPDAQYNWLTTGLHTEFNDFIAIGSKEGKANKQITENVIFKIYSRGVATSRDAWAYNFNQATLAENMQVSIDFYNYNVYKLKSHLSAIKTKKRREVTDKFVDYDNKKISWSYTLKSSLERQQEAVFSDKNIRISLYRPFTKSYLYFDNMMNEAIYRFQQIFPTSATEKENVVICVSDKGYRANYSTLITNVIPELHLCTTTDAIQCFPFYIYNEEGTDRQENITDWALTAYKKRYRDKSITKLNIFYYVYGLLHVPSYREKYALNLKKSLPHIPFAKDFWKIAKIGEELAETHLNYENAIPYQLTAEIKELLNWQVEKMKLSKDKMSLIYNKSLILHGIPAQVFDYKLGNRSALEWIIEQYRVKIDTRSGITNDPNQRDNERYIFNLVQKIVTVSLKTVKLVEELANTRF